MSKNRKIMKKYKVYIDNNIMDTNFLSKYE